MAVTSSDNKRINSIAQDPTLLEYIEDSGKLVE